VSSSGLFTSGSVSGFACFWLLLRIFRVAVSSILPEGIQPDGLVERAGYVSNRPEKLYALSFPRTREGGFTFEVQQFLPKELSGRFEVQTFPRCVIIHLDQIGELRMRDRGQVGFTRKTVYQ
jgi:hypothetical protein